MTKRRVEIGRGYDIYEVENFQGLTDDEIADKCDFNNWGYRVLERYPEHMLIKIYTDWEGIFPLKICSSGVDYYKIGLTKAKKYGIIYL